MCARGGTLPVLAVLKSPCTRVCSHPTPCVAQQQDIDKDQVLTAADFTNHTVFKPGAWDFLVHTFDGKSGGEHAGTCARFILEMLRFWNRCLMGISHAQIWVSSGFIKYEAITWEKHTIILTDLNPQSLTRRALSVRKGILTEPAYCNRS